MNKNILAPYCSKCVWHVDLTNCPAVYVFAPSANPSHTFHCNSNSIQVKAMNEAHQTTNSLSIIKNLTQPV